MEYILTEDIDKTGEREERKILMKYLNEKKNFNKMYSKIAKVLEVALESSFYKERINLTKEDIKRGISYETFQLIPILTKREYSKNIFDIINPKFELEKDKYYELKEDFNEKKRYLLNKGLYVKVTSGSTGIPLEVLKSMQDINRDYFSLNFFRRKVLGGLPEGNFLWIWPTNKYTQKYFYDDSDTNYYQVNEYGYQFMIAEYSEEYFSLLEKFIEEHNIQWITSSPSVLVYFADYIKSKGNKKFNMRYIECHSEALFEWQSDIIREMFGVTPQSVYSSNEIQFMGFTCKEGHMHLITRNVFMELIPMGNGRNEVIVTSLNNFDVPLVRYRLGDCAEWGETRECSLKKYPTIELKRYRCNDYLIGGEGKKYEPFVVSDAIMFLKAKFKVQIEKYVVYQKKREKLLCFVDAEDWIYQHKEKVVHFLTQYFEEITGMKYEIEILPYYSVLDYVKTSKYKYFILGDGIE